MFERMVLCGARGVMGFGGRVGLVMVASVMLGGGATVIAADATDVGAAMDPAPMRDGSASVGVLPDRVDEVSDVSRVGGAALRLGLEPAYTDVGVIRGRVRVWDGRGGGLLYDLLSPQSNDLFGFAGLVVGDVDGDGVGEVAVTAPLGVDVEGGFDRGWLGVYSGADGSLLRRIDGDPGETFGLSLARWRVGSEPALLVEVSIGEGASSLAGWRAFSLLDGRVLAEDLGEHARLAARGARSRASRVRIGPAGDVTGDGVVDVMDLAWFAEAMGDGAGGYGAADVDRDGRVDAFDLAMFGSTLGSESRDVVLSLGGSVTCDCGLALCNQGWCQVNPDPTDNEQPPYDEFEDDPPGSGTTPGASDTDGDGIPNSEDCDSEWYEGSLGACGCLDDDGDGVRNQNECGHECYIGDPGACCDGELRVELRADVDEDGQISEQDDLLEAAGDGATVLVSNGDSDGDGWPDSADGYDLIDDPTFDVDDESGGSFVPVYLSISGVQAGYDTIRLEYSDSDPMGASVVGGWETPGGHLRVWLRDSDESRSGLSVYEGGDYVPAGYHSLGSLGLEGCSSSITLYVESVRASAYPGDLALSVEMGSSDDAVRMTSVEVRMEGRWEDVAGWRLAPAFVPTRLYDLSDPPTPEEIALGQPAYLHRFQILDPRENPGEITVDGQAIPVGGADGAWVSSVFWVDSPPFFASPGGAPDPGTAMRVVVLGDDAEWQYNPRRKAPKVSVPAAANHEAEIQGVIDDVVAALEADVDLAWRAAYQPNDHGAFGKEVHKKVAERLDGSSRWHFSVWFDKESRMVLSIGGPPQGGTTKTMMEMDAIFMKKGQQLDVDDVFDWDRIEGVHEIKTSVRGSVSAAQRLKYNQVCQNSKWLVQMPERRFSDTEGWVDHERGKKLRAIGKALMGVSAAATVLAVAFPADLEGMADEVIAKYDQLLYEFEDPSQAPACAFEFGLALDQFMSARSGQEFTGLAATISMYVCLYFQESVE